MFDAISNGSNVDVMYIDFDKAFVKVNHEILCTKFEQISICGSLLSWLKSFLQDHYQIVAYKEF